MTLVLMCIHLLNTHNVSGGFELFATHLTDLRTLNMIKLYFELRPDLDLIRDFNSKKTGLDLVRLDEAFRTPPRLSR